MKKCILLFLSTLLTMHCHAMEYHYSKALTELTNEAGSEFFAKNGQSRNPLAIVKEPNLYSFATSDQKYVSIHPSIIKKFNL